MWFLTINVHYSLKYLQKIILCWLIEVVNKHLMHSSCNVDRFHLQLRLLTFIIFCSAEKIRNSLSVSSSRCDDNFEILPLHHNSLEKTKQNIVVDRSLMNIIQNNNRIVLQKRIWVQLLNQWTISCKYDPCIWIYNWVKSHFMRYFMVVASELLSHPFRYWSCCYFSGKNYTYLFVIDCVSCLN